MVQAAGRVIRSDTDQGVLWLLDERYAELATEFKLNDTGQGSIGFIGLD